MPVYVVVGPAALVGAATAGLRPPDDRADPAVTARACRAGAPASQRVRGRLGREPAGRADDARERPALVHRRSPLRSGSSRTMPHLARSCGPPGARWPPRARWRAATVSCRSSRYARTGRTGAGETTILRWPRTRRSRSRWARWLGRFLAMCSRWLPSWPSPAPHGWSPHAPSPWSRERASPVAGTSPGANPAWVSIRRRSTTSCRSMSLPRGGWRISVSEPSATLSLAIVLFGRRPDGFQQRQHLAPLDIATRGMAEDFLERVTMTVAKVRCHEPPSSGLRHRLLPHRQQHRRCDGPRQGTGQLPNLSGNDT